MDIQKQDWRFVPVDPDPDFSPEHNKRVIEETIKNSKRLSERKRRESSENVRERASAVAQYLASLKSGKTSSKVVDYFGRKETARLRGEEIADVLRAKIGDATKKKIREAAEIRAAKLRRTG